ncbi:MAG: hypothetical protein U1F77_19355 [Kiritimatiellia bacterium]
MAGSWRKEDIRALIAGFTDGSILDYQMAAPAWPRLPARHDLHGNGRPDPGP